MLQASVTATIRPVQLLLVDGVAGVNLDQGLSALYLPDQVDNLAPQIYAQFQCQPYLEGRHGVGIHGKLPDIDGGGGGGSGGCWRRPEQYNNGRSAHPARLSPRVSVLLIKFCPLPFKVLSNEEESDRGRKLYDASISNTFLESVRMFEIMSAITGRGSSTSPATPSTSSVLEHWLVT